MIEVVIVEAARTPIGRFRGALSGVRADHLGALVLKEVVSKAGITPEFVEDVIFGCVTQVGENSSNVARTALLSAGWPDSIPGMTVDRRCGSSEAAIHTAVGAIMSGAYEVVIAGGAENMTRVPLLGNRDVHGEPFGWLLEERYPVTHQGIAAEALSDKYSFTRNDLDDFAIESHRRAAAADDAGYFAREVVPVNLDAWQERDADQACRVVARDETIRRDTSREKLAKLKTVFRDDGGRVTAGNASQISDGAAAVLLMSRARAEELGLKPRARIRAIAAVGSDPVLMLTGPVAATKKALARSGLTLDDIDLFEVNEAFACVPLMWLKELGAPPSKLNVNGGAISLGHPLGATGARLMTSMLHELERRNARYGLQAICCAGGMGTATLIERLD